MKVTIFDNSKHTNTIISKPDITHEECKENLKHIHAIIFSQYLSSRKTSRVTYATPYDPMTFIHQTNIATSYAYKTGTGQSRQITTLAKLPTHSEL